MDGKLRNMTSLYLTDDTGILCLYRIGSRVADKMYIGSAGGHFEQEELNDACACVLREAREELGIYEKDTGRAVICDISGFPYTLIWSKPGMPRFVCIEPWHSIPSAENGDHKWEHKPAAATVNPGESWSTTLSMTFQR